MSSLALKLSNTQIKLMTIVCSLSCYGFCCPVVLSAPLTNKASLVLLALQQYSIISISVQLFPQIRKVTLVFNLANSKAKHFKFFGELLGNIYFFLFMFWGHANNIQSLLLAGFGDLYGLVEF